MEVQCVSIKHGILRTCGAKQFPKDKLDFLVCFVSRQNRQFLKKNINGNYKMILKK